MLIIVLLLLLVVFISHKKLILLAGLGIVDYLIKIETSIVWGPHIITTLTFSWSISVKNRNILAWDKDFILSIPFLLTPGYSLHFLMISFSGIEDQNKKCTDFPLLQDRTIETSDMECKIVFLRQGTLRRGREKCKGLFLGILFTRSALLLTHLRIFYSV